MKNDSLTERRARGRPRGFDSTKALDQALEVFWRLGYEGASIADLTEAMGIAAPSLYAAFGSKAELYRQVLERYRASQGASTPRALTEEPTARAAMERILREAARGFSNREHPRGCMISTAVLTCAEENQPVAEHVATLRAGALAALRTRLEQGIAEGELPAGTDPAALARYFGAIIQGMSVQAQDGASEAELLAIVEIAMRAWDKVARKSSSPRTRKGPAPHV
ncbi:TetR/AcrR family transcriptional regulator [Archangium violaceum]|uniref:TetR/AcrR family transcriptional regulator n=1 Tax=Archangium violaceum TaxID=83451 RepID=UPI0019503BC3|nr:TetR/AcrR family transcriptional regulator [Archangium violaceum]QRN98009.1 TetR/AcrR family transcriptional regulator [Archangium violaceum]